jgi:hypothetical protein
MGWSGFQRDTGSGVQLVGIEDALIDRFPVAGLPYVYEIVLSGRAVSPNETATTELEIRRLAEFHDGYVVATVRGHRRLATSLYLSSPDHADDFAAVTLPRRVSVEVRVAFDPTWQRFARTCPRGVELQSMDDFAVLGRLLEAGDNGDPRVIEHTVTSVAEPASAGLLAAVEQLGVSIDYLPRLVGERDRTAIVTHDAVPSDVTPIAWSVRGIAERFGARYEGWTCETVTSGRQASRPSTPARRRDRDSWW